MPVTKRLIRVGRGRKVHMVARGRLTYCGLDGGKGVREAPDSDICNNCWRVWFARTRG